VIGEFIGLVPCAQEHVEIPDAHAAFWFTNHQLLLFQATDNATDEALVRPAKYGNSVKLPGKTGYIEA